MQTARRGRRPCHTWTMNSSPRSPTPALPISPQFRSPHNSNLQLNFSSLPFYPPIRARLARAHTSTQTYAFERLAAGSLYCIPTLCQNVCRLLAAVNPAWRAWGLIKMTRSVVEGQKCARGEFSSVDQVREAGDRCRRARQGSNDVSFSHPQKAYHTFRKGVT